MYTWNVKRRKKVKRHSKVVLKKGKKGPIDPKRNDRPPSPLGVRRAIRVRRHLPWLWHDSSSFHPWSFDRISQSPHCMYLHHLTRKKDLKTLWNLPWERVFFGHYEHFWNWYGKKKSIASLKTVAAKNFCNLHVSSTDKKSFSRKKGSNSPFCHSFSALHSLGCFELLLDIFGPFKRIHPNLNESIKVVVSIIASSRRKMHNGNDVKGNGSRTTYLLGFCVGTLEQSCFGN